MWYSRRKNKDRGNSTTKTYDNPYQDYQADHENEPQSNRLINEKAASPIAIIYRSELDYLSRCILDYPNIETGGQLFGFWTSQGAPVVLYVIGPGTHANHQPTFFNQDSNYLMTVGNALLERYGLCHIGEWHSHHQLGLARPSGHDATTMFHGLQAIPQRRLLLCIGNYENGCTSINPYTFHENHMNRYVDAIWQVIDMESPYRHLIDCELSHLLIHPRNPAPNHGNNRLIEHLQADNDIHTVSIKHDYWLTQENNIVILKKILEITQEIFTETAPIQTQINEEGIMQIYVQKYDMAIRFPEKFPMQAPELYVQDRKIDSFAQWQTPYHYDAVLPTYYNWVKEMQLNKL